MIKQLNVHPQKINDEFLVTLTATGNTYNHKDILKQHGFKFYDGTLGGIHSKWWEIQIQGDMATLRDAIEAIRTAIPHERFTRSA